MQQQQYWHACAATNVPLLAQLCGGGVSTRVGQTSKADFALDETLTEQLLSQGNRAYRTQINELLLAGLLLAVHRFAGANVGGNLGASAVRFDMEGHGRQMLSDELDLSQTVGWFSTLYPLTLSLEQGVESAHSPSHVICAVKEQYRSVPDGGIGSGLLKHISRDPVLTAMPALKWCLTTWVKLIRWLIKTVYLAVPQNRPV